MPSKDPLARLQDAAALWSVGSSTPADVIEAACACLVAGVDSPTLRILAGLPSTPAGESDELRRWLPAALAELSLAFHPENSREAQEAAVRIMASRLLAGAITPSELTSWAYHCITIEGTPIAYALVRLDDAYEVAQHSGPGLGKIDAAVRAEARRLVDTAAGATGDPPPPSAV
ncbi:hypothetical protein E0H26_07375 [Micromonospora zingiberis]|uniref:Uncharacterized protein n=1 Tax=Micromonospora zingiberis TaxID=2053011 RepID=A0A4R0GNY4_9ACTN|nr:hypothetical protein [Micromonospora zingiberis]TCB99206.1 hypothetical protein E0H26_07375 [Micromonospora zingiberis]